ncbi:MAG TPA: plastocyanin/azurin family copper-binding protein [Actinomycetota bacterium]|nr:plastocyanin/azurin family copper-binding protein [Actinomycetota bacterium]
MTRRVIAAVAMALALAACGGEGGADEQPVRTDRVLLPKSYRFEPPVIAVEPGTTVTWVNEDDFPHNVHLLDGSDVTEDLPIGETATITFDEPGEVPYECSLHPQQMQGKVMVG